MYGEDNLLVTTMLNHLGVIMACTHDNDMNMSAEQMMQSVWKNVSDGKVIMTVIVTIMIMIVIVIVPHK